VRNRKKKDLTAELLKRGYDRFPDKPKNKKEEEEEDDEDEDEEDEDEETSVKKTKVTKDKVHMDNLDKDYNYLLSMKIWSLTAEHIELLKKKLAEKKEELNLLSARTPRDMWEEELDYFMELWDVFEKDLNDFENNVGKTGKKKIKMPVLQANARAKAKERAIQRAKDRENGKEEMSVDEVSVEEEKTEPTTKTRNSQTVSAKSAPGKKKTIDNTSTKATIKKKDEMQTKKGKRTLHDYFSIETSGDSVTPQKKLKEVSSSESPKKPVTKKNLSKSLKTETSKEKIKTTKPKSKKSKVSTESDSASYYDSESETAKTDKSEVKSRTQTEGNESVFDSKDEDSLDNAASETDSDTVTIVKKHVTRNSAKGPAKKTDHSDSD